MTLEDFSDGREDLVSDDHVFALPCLHVGIGLEHFEANSQSFVPLGVFSSNFWPLGAISRPSSLRFAVTEKFRGHVSVPPAFVNLIDLEGACNSCNDLADLNRQE